MRKEKELGPMGPLGALRRLEVDPDTYNELDQNLRTAASVAGAVKGLIPSHLALRLEGAIAKCQGAVGSFTTTQRPPMWDADLLKVEDLVRRLDMALVEAGRIATGEGMIDPVLIDGLHREAEAFLHRADLRDGKSIRVAFVTPSGFHYELHPSPITEADVARGNRI